MVFVNYILYTSYNFVKYSDEAAFVSRDFDIMHEVIGQIHEKKHFAARIQRYNIRRIVPRGANRNSLFAVTRVRPIFPSNRERGAILSRENLPARAGNLGGKRRDLSATLSSRSSMAREPLLQVTPVNLVPEAVATHGIRGSGTRLGQIRRLYGRAGYLVPLVPFSPGLCAPVSPCRIAFPLPLRLSVRHARCIYVDLVGQREGEGE